MLDDLREDVVERAVTVREVGEPTSFTDGSWRPRQQQVTGWVGVIGVGVHEAVGTEHDRPVVRMRELVRRRERIRVRQLGPCQPQQCASVERYRHRPGSFQSDAKQPRVPFIWDERHGAVVDRQRLVNKADSMP